MLGFQGLKEMINAHPLFTHFPLALLPASALFYLLGALFKKNGLSEAGRWTLWFGTLAAALAVWTGFRAAGTVEHNEEVHAIMTLHQNLSYVVLGLGALLSGWVLAVRRAAPQKGGGIFLALLIMLAFALAQQADLGGRMVFAYGTGVGRKSMAPKHVHNPNVHHSHEETELVH